MKKQYNLPEMEILLIEEEIVRTSPNYGSDSTDDWGDDIWD